MLLLRRAPSKALGLLVAVVAVALTTAIIYPLREVTSPVSTGVVYLLAVLVAAILGGRALGLLTALASAAAFNFFHIPPTGRFTVADGENWVALAVFLIAAVVVSALADVARGRAREANERRRDAELAAELARVLLGAAEPQAALPTAAKRIADAYGLPAVALTLEPVQPGARQVAVPMQAGALLVPAAISAATLETLRERLVPALEPLLFAAFERATLTREVVETKALRRSDEIKTAVLRSVSHDLRSPLTAIRAAGEALGSPALEAEDRRELAEAIGVESRRLARLVDKLLDLSRLEGGAAEPREDWCSLEEVIRGAAEDSGAPPDRLRLMIDRDLPLIRADPAQLERALANLIENALRYGDGRPVSVRARASGGRVLVRVVDQGPGIPLAEQERIFEPFYRAPGAASHGTGSGLGLAIVRGLIEANGGHVRVESLPGQGTSFVVDLPLPAAVEAPR
jgi:two-component system sensor histidine kinase KdpD